MSNLTSALNVDVAVIGAGLSGLQAARSLHEAGLSYAVIEATDRIGGKVFSQELSSIDGVVEMGPTWINNLTQPKMTSLADGYGIEYIEQYLDGLAVIYEGDGVAHTTPPGGAPEDATEEELIKVQLLLGFMEIEAQKFDPARPEVWVNGSAPLLKDTSLADLMKEKKIEPGTFSHTFLTAGHRTIFGLDPDEVSLFYLLDLLKQCKGWQSLLGDNYTDAQYQWLPGGMAQIPRAMAAGLNPDSVILQDPVTNVKQTNDSATVLTLNGRTINAKKVIVTVPSYTYTRIDFQPPLSTSKRALATNSIGGRTTKSAILYSNPWWRELGLLGKFTSAANGSVTTTWELSYQPNGLYALVLFTVGEDYDLHFAGKGALDRQASLLDDLADIVAAAVGEEHREKVYEVVEYHDQDWYMEPYFDGSPQHAVPPGTFKELMPALREVDGHVHFGGAETASVWMGYMEGAIDSGERVAEEVVEVLGNGTRKYRF